MIDTKGKKDFYQGEIICRQCMSSNKDEGNKEDVLAYKNDDGSGVQGLCRCCGKINNAKTFKELHDNNYFIMPDFDGKY